MSIEYQQRGVLHKLTNTKKLCPQQSKNVLIKWTTKTALAAETAVLFSKDVAVNRFVGKETHIKFERSQNESGKFKTHIKLVRAEAPQQLPKGVLHKLNNINRFVEGDKPLQKKPKIKYEPKSLKGEMAYGALSSSKAVVKNSAKFAKATALTGETVLTKAGSTGLRQIQYKLRNDSDVHDSGKAVMTGITALQTINRGRKYLINYRRSRAAYKQQKIKFEGQKQQLKVAKSKLKDIRKENRPVLRKLRVKRIVVFGDDIKRFFKYHKRKSLSLTVSQKAKIHFHKKQILGNITQPHRTLKKAKRAYRSEYINERRKRIKRVNAIRRTGVKKAKLTPKKTVQRIKVTPYLLRNESAAKVKLKNTSRQLRRIRKAKTHKAIHLKKQEKAVKRQFAFKHKDNYKRHRKLSTGKKLVLKSKIKYRKQLNHSEKAVYKNLKKQKRFAKKEAKQSKVLPIAALPLVPSAALAKRLTSTYARKAVYADTDNDFMQAAEKTARGASAVNRATKPVRNKLHQKHTQHKKGKLQAERNRLTSKNADLKKNKRKYTKKKQSTKKASEKAKEAAKKVAQKIKKAIGNFVKLAVRILGAVLLPILIIVFVFIIIMLMFTGISDNSSYILGTYNAQDKDISKAIECYTEIAYDFNKYVIQCGDSEHWKNGLRSMGVNTNSLSSYRNTPNHFLFGRSSRFSQTPTYDFDPDKLAAFMCAYFYEPDSDGNVKNWKWKDEYKVVLQELFDTEYSFAHYYEDYSGWKEYNQYAFYGGGGSDHSYYTVYFDGFSKDKMKIRGVPSEIRQFCKDGYLHYNYSTLEVLDANNSNKKTGYFIHDQREIVCDRSGQAHYPFYRVHGVTNKEVEDKYSYGGSIHYHTGNGHVLDSGGCETNYFVNNIHAANFTYSKYVWQQNQGGSIVNVDRNSWYWNADKTQIFCAVTPWDTKKWNSTLENTCLVDFYKKNYWYDDCTLYYTVKQDFSFEGAIKKVIQNKNDNTQARLDFYQALTQANEQGHQTYGNHQMMNAPTGGKSLQSLINGNKILNNYGYDMQEWNKTHCSGLTDVHKGMDILASRGDYVYAMFDGKIDDIDSSKQTIRLKTTSNMDFWYDNNSKREVEAVYSNVQATVHKGDTVSQGQVIGKVTNKKRCFDNLDIHSSRNYLHITVKIKYGSFSWSEVDPRFLIYRNDNEAK